MVNSNESDKTGQTTTVLEEVKCLLMREPVDVPQPSTWPNRPVFFCVNTPVSPHLHVPKFGSGPCPIGVPFHFTSELFEGQCLLRLRNVTSDNTEGDVDYFRGRRRLFQTIVQGRFKEPLLVSEVLTGHEFVRPLQHLPHPWMIKAGTTLIRTLAPGANICVHSQQPVCMAIMAATSQTVRVDICGKEPDILSIAIQEDCTMMGGDFENGKVSSSGRKSILSHPLRAQEYTYNTDSVYTFDFYQSLLDVSTYSLDLGIIKLGLSPVLDGQPIQCLSKTRDGRYLWSFQIWHENLLPTSQDIDTEPISPTEK